MIVKGVKKGGLGGEGYGKEWLMRDRSDGIRREESDLHDLHLLYVWCSYIPFCNAIPYRDTPE